METQKGPKNIESSTDTLKILSQRHDEKGRLQEVLYLYSREDEQSTLIYSQYPTFDTAITISVPLEDENPGGKGENDKNVIITKTKNYSLRTVIGGKIGYESYSKQLPVSFHE